VGGALRGCRRTPTRKATVGIVPVRKVPLGTANMIVKLAADNDKFMWPALMVKC